MAFRCAFRPLGLLPIAIVLLAALAILVPWRTCRLCLGESDPDVVAAQIGQRLPIEVGWICPVCRDSGRCSLLSPLLRRRTAPVVERFAEAGFPRAGNEYPRRLDALLDHAGVDRNDVRGYERQQWRFLETDEGGCFVFLVSDFEPRGKAARAFLFDLDGALLDRVDIADDDSVSNVELGFSAAFRDDGTFLLATATLRGPAPPSGLILRVRRDRRREKQAPETIASVPGVALAVGVRNGRWVVP